jgi:copper(I)-binding protein
VPALDTRDADRADGSRRPFAARRLHVSLAAALVAAGLLISGCAAGQRAQTAIAKPVLDGVEADSGQLSLRAISIVTPANGSYPKGGSAALQLYISNTGPDDQLVQVKSGGAAAVTVAANAAAAFAAPTATASAGASAGASIDLASGELTTIGVKSDQPQVILTGLSAQLYPAMSIPVTFYFAKASPVTVYVAVHLSDGSASAPVLPTTHPASTG